MKIAVDFDGVLMKHEDIPSKVDWNNDRPVEGAVDAIKLFLKEKHEVWVFTSNLNIEQIKSWLKRNGFPELEITSIKKPATVYIDDRGLRFTNWNDIRKHFT
jgi:hypothetical protein